MSQRQQMGEAGDGPGQARPEGEGPALILRLAAAKGLPKLARSLALSQLEAGGLTLEPARLSGEQELRAWFEDAIEERSQIASAARASGRGLAAVRALLAAGWAGVEGPGSPGSVAARALESACSTRDLALLETLLEAGAEPHWSPGDHFFKTPIGRCLEKKWEEGAKALTLRLREGHFAQRSSSGLGFLEALFCVREPAVWAKRASWASGLAREWLERGAQLDERVGKAKRTALLAVIQKEACPQAVAALMSLGPDLNAVDAKGATALMSAARLGQTETARALLDAGADAEVLDAQGQSALDLARARGSSFGAQRPEADELIQRLSRLRQAQREAKEIEARLSEEDARLGRALRLALAEGARVEMEGQSVGAQELLDRAAARPARSRPGL